MPDVANPLLFGACYASFIDHEQGTYCIMDTMGQNCKSQAQILSTRTYRPAGSNLHYGALSLYGAHFTTPHKIRASAIIPFDCGCGETSLKLVSGGSGIRIYIFPGSGAHILTYGLSRDDMDVHAKNS